MAELKSLLSIHKINYQITNQIGNCVAVKTEKEIDAQKLMRESGGVVKISKMIGSSKYYVLSITGKEIENRDSYSNFGISLVGFKENIKKISEELKPQLNLHYILPKEGYQLSSAQLTNRKILEIVIMKNKNEYDFFQTAAIQDINYWTRKDVNRSYIDDRLGMLPLKVARMMINIGREITERNKGEITLLDPFCGLGSILQEAVDVGFKNIIGGDVNALILKKCEENLNWFINEFKYQHVNMLMVNCDAANISGKIDKKVDLIVTEPFLGDAKIIQNLKIKHQNDRLKLKNIIKGLSKMYLGAMKDWKKILNNDAAVVIIVPEIELGNKVFTLPFLEICRKSGYNIVGNYEYSRESAIVKRKIFILRLVNTHKCHSRESGNL